MLSLVKLTSNNNLIFKPNLDFQSTINFRTQKVCQIISYFFFLKIILPQKKLFFFFMVRTFNYSRSKSAPSISLLDFLVSSFKYLNKEQWIDAISQKHYVSIDNIICVDPTAQLPVRCKIGFDVPAELEPEVDERMELIFLDEHICVVSKSGNIPVSECGKYSKRTLVQIAAKKFLVDEQRQQQQTEGASFISVHRLDKETSGLVVLARTHEAAVNLSRQFSRCSEDCSNSENNNNSNDIIIIPTTRRRTRNDDDDDDNDEGGKEGNIDNSNLRHNQSPVSKEYIAILVGEIKEETEIRLRIGHEKEWIEMLARNNNKNKTGDDDLPVRKLSKFRMICAPEEMKEFGRDAKTKIIPIKCDKGLTLCRVQLFTGRTHQIRIHCAAIGFPLLGDKLYVSGGDSVDCDTYLRRAKGEEKVVVEIPWEADAENNEKIKLLHVERHLLHAAKLSFLHPVIMNKPMSFESDPEKTFLEACPELAEFKLF